MNLATALSNLVYFRQRTSSLDLNIKVIGNDVHNSVYDKRKDFGFPIVNFPCLSGDVPRLPSYGAFISQLVRFARCCTSVSDVDSKNLQILPNYWHRITDITSFEKHLESSSDHTLTFHQNLVKYRFKNMFRKESLTRYSTYFSDIVYKLRRVKMRSDFRLVGL